MTESAAASYAFGAVITIALLAFFFLGRAAQFFLDRGQAEREAGATEPCQRCGKPVAVGAELYHQKRCRGVKSQRHYRIGPGDPFTR